MNQGTHTTRLKQRILAHFPGMRAQNIGRDVFLIFEKDIGEALAKVCQKDSDSDGIHLARAAAIFRKQFV